MGAAPSPSLYNVPGNDTKYDNFASVYFAPSSTHNVIIQNVEINAKCSKHGIYGNEIYILEVSILIY